MTAAAMGIERPVVSLGILGGSDRLLGGSGLPPLLVCDVHSSETSSGAAMVDREGKLVGIVAAASDPAQRVGWTYAVPVRHVQRLIAARAENRQVVLQRQRPTAGLTLGQGQREGTVRVERVDAGGPADKAGIKSGDLVLDVEGHKIRSAYQAVDLILKKQPGDKVQFLVEQGGRSRPIDLTLGGVLAPLVEPRQPLESTVQVGPQVNVTLVRPNEIEVRRGATTIEDLKADPNAAQARSQRDDMGTLKSQLAVMEREVADLRDEVRRREEAEAKTAELIKSLKAEIEQLHKRQEKP
jgi:hypothetical protein